MPPKECSGAGEFWIQDSKDDESIGSMGTQSNVNARNGHKPLEHESVSSAIEHVRCDNIEDGYRSKIDPISFNKSLPL